MKKIRMSKTRIQVGISCSYITPESAEHGDFDRHEDLSEHVFLTIAEAAEYIADCVYREGFSASETYDVTGMYTEWTISDYSTGEECQDYLYVRFGKNFDRDLARDDLSALVQHYLVQNHGYSVELAYYAVTGRRLQSQSTGTGESTVDTDSFAPFESGDEWHAYLDFLGQKYGKDYQTYRFGVDFLKLTDVEFEQYQFIYNRMLVARGLPSVKLNRATGEHDRHIVEPSKTNLHCVGGQGFSFAERARYRVSRRTTVGKAQLSLVK